MLAWLKPPEELLLWARDLLENSTEFPGNNFPILVEVFRENTHDPTFGIEPPQKMMFTQISFPKVEWHNSLL